RSEDGRQGRAFRARREAVEAQRRSLTTTAAKGTATGRERPFYDGSLHPRKQEKALFAKCFVRVQLRKRNEEEENNDP
ncbi:MAG TPA: hypothetical protein VKQ28_07940, partial [Candidatus Acidoferrum sp.]|nr:hypothetical protein [Candidatus Acidoferrum sp.]